VSGTIVNAPAETQIRCMIRPGREILRDGRFPMMGFPYIA